MARIANAHTAVKHELLVRYLDAWTPTVLHTARQVAYAEGRALAGVGPGREDGSAGVALRVFAEFADRLAGHELEMVLADADRQRLDALAGRLAGFTGMPPGLTIRTTDDLVPALARHAGPVFAYLDAPQEPPALEVLRALVRHRASEVLVVLDPAQLMSPGRAYADAVTGYRDSLHRAGLSAVAHVELVDGAGVAQLLFFGTRSAKNLEKFKTELWAVDEYAGVRYRDPRDVEHELLDISASPPVGPLRRSLLATIRADRTHTVAELRQHTASETMYRTEEATRALSGLLTAGTLAREPEKGRLNADTVLRPAG